MNEHRTPPPTASPAGRQNQMVPSTAQRQASTQTQAAANTLQQRMTGESESPLIPRPRHRYQKPRLLLIGSAADLLDALGPAQANYGGTGLP